MSGTEEMCSEEVAYNMKDRKSSEILKTLDKTNIGIRTAFSVDHIQFCTLFQNFPEWYAIPEWLKNVMHTDRGRRIQWIRSDKE